MILLAALLTVMALGCQQDSYVDLDYSFLDQEIGKPLVLEFEPNSGFQVEELGYLSMSGKLKNKSTDVFVNTIDGKVEGIDLLLEGADVLTAYRGKYGQPMDGPKFKYWNLRNGVLKIDPGEIVFFESHKLQEAIRAAKDELKENVANDILN